MKREVVIMDNFYDNPYKVWELAKELPRTDEPGGGHFARTIKSYLPKNAIDIFSNLVGEEIDPNPHFLPEQMFVGDNFNGSFYTVPPGKRAPTHVHHDQQEWVGQVYLTPPEVLPGVEAGTGLFRHIETQAHHSRVRLPFQDDNLCAYDNNNTVYKDWEMHTYIGNIFNRLVLYRADMFHAARLEPKHHEHRFAQLFCFSTMGWTGLRGRKSFDPEHHVTARHHERQ